MRADASSERQLTTELHPPRAHRGTGDVAERGGFVIAAGSAERRMVPYVEGLRAEREPQPLFERERLEEREIRVRHRRSAEAVAAHVAVREDTLRNIAWNREGALGVTGHKVSAA